MSTSRRSLVLRFAVLAILVGMVSACVSREESTGAKEAPFTVDKEDVAEQQNLREVCDTHWRST